MASILVPPAVESIEPADRLFTTADLPLFPTDLPSGPVDYELNDGRLTVMAPPGQHHSYVQLEIGTEFKLQGQRRGYGRAYTEVGVVLSRNPDNVLGPDVAFVGKSKLPVRESTEGYLETIPDLVVEVRSKNDSAQYVTKKVAKYLAAGVGMVWVADGNAKTIVVHRPGCEPRTYGATDTLELDDPIPGFRLNVAAVFVE
jgi:Uma2 family endonuclease